MIDIPKTPQPVHVVDQIDLDSHAVIEASAGTGKTHTIEELVVALLRSGRVESLDEILVMTFTEKAAGELKDRIRNIIIGSLKREASDILKVSLDNFDTASIFTIHGFCNKIIQEYAFENREQFQNELIDDRTVYQSMLRQVMRMKWPKQYGDSLGRILKLSDFPDLTGDGRSRWEERVIEIALRYQPEGSDELVPRPEPDPLKKIRNAEKACSEFIDEVMPLVGAIDEENLIRSELCVRYTRLNIRKNSMAKRVRLLTSVLKLIVSRGRKQLFLHDIADFLANKDIGDEGFHELNTGWTKKGDNHRQELPELENIIRILEKLNAIDISGLKNLLAAATILDIKAWSTEHKKIRGLISYDDMINRVCSALSDQRGNLKRIIQNRYRYALVDEFQDTDMQQWNIFKSIFLGTERNRLFIVSDPKQAIYGFRGADINAYYIARDEMIHSYGARYYCLVENWRSSPGLIKIFNEIFGNNEWFADSHIGYLPSQYPSAKEPNAIQDQNCLFVIDCGICTGTEAKFKAAEYIAHEINSIVQSDMHIAPSEIAVLVRKWREAETVEKSLKKAGIRYSYYKKEGLYQSKEALELFYLLSSIAKPNDKPARKKSLVTRFFGIPVHALRHFDGVPTDHPVSILFDRWHAYSDQKNWPHLFQSIIEDSGILFRPGFEDRDRAIINYRTIIQNVQIEAVKKNYSIHEIVEYLNRLRMQGSHDHEGHNLEKIDIENPGVQIMTIHASKGLQFRMIFIAGGFTRRDVSEFWTYHRNSTRIFDLVRESGNEKYYSREMSGEEERLFYVACTRTKERLYVPVFQPKTSSKSSCGILGGKLPSALEAIRHEDGVKWIADGSIQYQILEKKAHKSAPAAPLLLPDPLFPDPEMNFLGRIVPVDSFSGLKTKLYQQNTTEKLYVEFGDAGLQSGEDDVSYIIEAGDESVKHQAIHELPRGMETGLMLHEILEHIDFDYVDNAAHPAELLLPNTDSGIIIADAVQEHARFAKKESIEYIKNESARIVWNALRTPLNSSDLFLSKIKKKIHEVEFYYPSELIEQISIPGISYLDGFIHGFIDLIFIHDDKFYMIDWKSNYLEGGYSITELQKNFREMHYDLQISLYLSALLRWLEQSMPGYTYETHFGGVYYLYLRGMDIGNPGSGIFFYRPDDEHEMMYVPNRVQ